MLEDESTARSFLRNKSIGKDLVLDYSLIRISKPIPRPDKTKSLKIRMEGIDSSLIPNDHRQKVVENENGSSKQPFIIKINTEDLDSFKGQTKAHPSSIPVETLDSTISIQAKKENRRQYMAGSQFHLLWIF